MNRSKGMNRTKGKNKTDEGKIKTDQSHRIVRIAEPTLNDTTGPESKRALTPGSANKWMGEPVTPYDAIWFAGYPVLP